MYNPPWGLRPHPPSHRHSLMEWALSFTERPVVDTLTALIADNLFGRFPRLRVLSVEYGSSWVAPLLHKLDHLARLFSKDMWRFGVPPLTPSDMFRQNVWVAPFFEDDVVGAGALDRRRRTCSAAPTIRTPRVCSGRSSSPTSWTGMSAGRGAPASCATTWRR